MLLKSALLCCLFLGTMVSCSSTDESEDAINKEEEVIEETKEGSYYFFGDDNIECAPVSQGKTLVSIVHIISKPCQSSSAALTFYFEVMQEIEVGSYEVLASESINVYPEKGQVSIVFYSHDSKNWYAQSGTVTITTNSDDSSKIDLKFKNLIMKAEDGTETTFTGQIIGV